MKHISNSKIVSTLLFFILVFQILSCERIENSQAEENLQPKSASISQTEVQRILNTKVNLESFQVTDDVRFSIPENYYFQTEFVERDEYIGENMFGKLDLSAKDNYSTVELHNSLFTNYSLYDEWVYVVKEQNPNLLKMEDIKADYGSETIYYEDQNSIVFSADNSFTTLHFQYDQKSKSYLIYTGTISWSKEFSLDEKLDLAFYFLRNARNLLNTNLSKQEFTWKDYVENRPKIEINLMKNTFANFDKEMNVFLDENQSVSPTFDSYSFVQLYRFHPSKEAEIYTFLNNSLNYDDNENNKWLRNIFSRITGYGSDNKVSITPKGNSSVICISKFNEGKKYNEQVEVICVVNFKNKAFLLKNENSLNEKDVDFYVTMFNYFSNNYTLEFSKK